MEIKFKPLSVDAVVPKKGTVGAIAFDLYVPNDTYVPVGRSIVPLDFAIELPLGYEFKIEPRSGFSSKGMDGVNALFKNGGTLMGDKCHRYNCDVLPGKVDSDYRGCVGVILRNADLPFFLRKGTRLAQGTVYHSPETAYFVTVTDLDDSERGDGGFGHTGVM